MIGPTTLISKITIPPIHPDTRWYAHQGHQGKYAPLGLAKGFVRTESASAITSPLRCTRAQVQATPPQRQVAMDIRKKAPENEKCRGVGMQEWMTLPALYRGSGMQKRMTPPAWARQGPPGGAK